MSSKTVGTHDLIDLHLTLDWASPEGQHKDIRHFNAFNVWRDIDLLPMALQKEILNRPQGHTGSVTLAAGDIVSRPSNALVHQVPLKNFQRLFRGREIAPHAGRFYPQGMVSGLPGVFPESIEPLRISDIQHQTMTCDLNHPLAGFELTVSATIGEIYGTPDEHGGRCQDAMQQLLHGPGMQIRVDKKPTDFFSGQPFLRLDERPDNAFYQTSRMTDHLDTTTLTEVAHLHASLLTKSSRVLDLMASVNSHLTADLAHSEVVGLGMNDAELNANPALTERLIHDLNDNPTLSFGDESFDAVVCCVSVEYLTRPLEVFSEVSRVLKPGGVFITTFSNRWFPPKVISLWIDLHEFERMGLVSEYFLRTEGFGKVHTFSQQGIKRPEDDKYSAQTALSDPLFAVWAYKQPD